MTSCATKSNPGLDLQAHWIVFSLDDDETDIWETER